MLQAFIDDSKSEGSPPFFILGGYIATADTWVRFSAEWQRALEMRPRIRYFKLREALRGEGEFNGASEALRMERAGVMRGVIELFPISAFSIGFRIDHLEETHAGFAKRWLNPYYTAVAALLPELARALDDFELPRETLDIVFDDQVMEKVAVLGAWESLRAHAVKFSHRLDPPDILSHILKNSPRWADDKYVLPLQAADMQATWKRIAMEEERDGRKPQPMPGARKALRQVTFTLDRDFFEARKIRISRAMKEETDEP